MKRKHTVDMRTEVQAWWEQCEEWMLYYKCQCAPLVLDMKGFSACIPGKEEDARVDAQKRYCAKGWQTREDTCQLKRRRLLPDPPEQEDAEVDMTDIKSFAWMAWRTTLWCKRCYEGLREARAVSPSLRVFTGRFCLCWVCVVFVCFVAFCRSRW